MSELWLGTSGYSYAAWRGSFYPDDLPAKQMLRYYGERFDSVEINATFYRMPTRAMLEGWVDQVPPGFRFVLKAPRRISHQKELAKTPDDIAFFAEQATALGEKRGPLLFQLPPHARKDVAALARLLAAVPAGFQVALEFRHPSWSDDEVQAVLREHGAALCISDELTDLPDAFVPTARFAYLRLRAEQYDDATLASVGERLRAGAYADAYVFFKHEDAGTGPKLAARFAALWREPKSAAQR